MASEPPFLIIPPLLPQGKVDLSSPRTGRLFYLICPELISLSHKIAHLSGIPFWGFGGYCTHFGGRITVTPTHYTPRFLIVLHTFLSLHFFSQIPAPPILWLATFVSIVFRLGLVCTSSRHTYALPYPYHLAHPSLPALPFSSYPLPFSWGSAVRITVRFLGPSFPVSLRVVLSSATDQRCALCPYRCCLWFAHLVGGRSWIQSHSVCELVV